MRSKFQRINLNSGAHLLEPFAKLHQNGCDVRCDQSDRNWRRRETLYCALFGTRRQSCYAAIWKPPHKFRLGRP
ncbi:unnamed protein product, partial [Iphiclides podalirius]